MKQTSICLLFTLHTSHQTTNSLKPIKSVLTQIYIKQNIHKRQTQNFRGISPFGIALLKKHRRLGHAGIVNHSVDLSIPDLKKKYKKGMDRNNNEKDHINA